MHLCNGVVDPLTDEWMAVLVDGQVVLAGCDEGVCWVEVSYVEDRVDCYGEKI